MRWWPAVLVLIACGDGEQAVRLGDAPGATLRLPAGAPPAAGPPIADGPRWGVMWAEAYMTDDEPLKKAEAYLARLTAAGVAGAEIVDSRRVRTLWCCSQAVVVGRHAGTPEAVAQERALAKKGFEDLLVRELC